MASDIRLTVDGDTRKLEKSIRRASSKGIQPLDSRGFSRPLGKISGQLGEFEKSLDASNARVLAFGASASAIFAVQQAVSASIESFLNLEKTLAEINVILGTSQENLIQLSEGLFDVAKNTAQSFGEVAEAAKELARQGLGAEETLKRTNDALILSRLTGLSAAESVNTLTAALNGFSAAALDSTQVTSKLIAVDQAFAVSGADLAEALRRVGSTAATAGVSIDQLLGIVTAAQQITARGGAVIGNSFKTIFTRLQRPRTLDALEEIGIRTRDASGATLPLIGILQTLAASYDNLNDAQQSQIAQLIGGVFQVNVLKASLQDLGRQYSIFGRATDISANATNEANVRNAELNKTLSAQIGILGSNLQKLGAVFGELTFEPALKNVVGLLNSFLGSLKLGDEASGFGEKIAKGVLSGFGNFLSGPGLVLAGAGLFKLFKVLTAQARDAFQTIIKIDSAGGKREQTQRAVVALLQQDKELQSAILSGTLSTSNAIAVIKQRIEANIQAQQRFNQVAKQASVSGIGFSKQKGSLNLSGRAAGYMPSPRQDAFRQEESMAVALGASKNVKAHMSKGKIGGKKFVMNDQEVEIPNFGKNGDSAVIPKYYEGFIPNLARAGSPISSLLKTGDERGLREYIMSESPTSRQVGGAIAQYTKRGGTLSSGMTNVLDEFYADPKTGKASFGQRKALREESRDIARKERQAGKRLNVLGLTSMGERSISKAGVREFGFSDPKLVQAFNRNFQKRYKMMVGGLFGDMIAHRKDRRNLMGSFSRVAADPVASGQVKGRVFESIIGGMTTGAVTRPSKGTESVDIGRGNRIKGAFGGLFTRGISRLPGGIEVRLGGAAGITTKDARSKRRRFDQLKYSGYMPNFAPNFSKNKEVSLSKIEKESYKEKEFSKVSGADTDFTPNFAKTKSNLYDLDGTLINEGFFDWKNPAKVLDVQRKDLTPLGKQVAESGKSIDIATARDKTNAPYIKQALNKIGIKVNKVLPLASMFTSRREMGKRGKPIKLRTPSKKNLIATSLGRDLVDNDPRNIEALGSRGILYKGGRLKNLASGYIPNFYSPNSFTPNFQEQYNRRQQTSIDTAKKILEASKTSTSFKEISDKTGFDSRIVQNYFGSGQGTPSSLFQTDEGRKLAEQLQKKGPDIAKSGKLLRGGGAKKILAGSVFEQEFAKFFKISSSGNAPIDFKSIPAAAKKRSKIKMERGYTKGDTIWSQAGHGDIYMADKIIRDSNKKIPIGRGSGRRGRTPSIINLGNSRTVEILGNDTEYKKGLEKNQMLATASQIVKNRRVSVKGQLRKAANQLVKQGKGNTKFQLGYRKDYVAFNNENIKEALKEGKASGYIPNFLEGDTKLTGITNSVDSKRSDIKESSKSSESIKSSEIFKNKESASSAKLMIESSRMMDAANFASFKDSVKSQDSSKTSDMLKSSQLSKSSSSTMEASRIKDVANFNLTEDKVKTQDSSKVSDVSKASDVSKVKQDSKSFKSMIQSSNIDTKTPNFSQKQKMVSVPNFNLSQDVIKNQEFSKSSESSKVSEAFKNKEFAKSSKAMIESSRMMDGGMAKSYTPNFASDEGFKKSVSAVSPAVKKAVVREEAAQPSKAIVEYSSIIGGLAVYNKNQKAKYGSIDTTIVKDHINRGQVPTRQNLMKTGSGRERYMAQGHVPNFAVGGSAVGGVEIKVAGLQQSINQNTVANKQAASVMTVLSQATHGLTSAEQQHALTQQLASNSDSELIAASQQLEREQKELKAQIDKLQRTHKRSEAQERQLQSANQKLSAARNKSAALEGAMGSRGLDTGKAAGGGIGDKALGASFILPMLSAPAEGLAKSMGAAASTTELVTNSFNGLATGAAVLFLGINPLTIAIAGITAAFMVGKAVMKKFATKNEDLIEEAEAAKGGFQKLNDAAGSYSQTLQQLSDALKSDQPNADVIVTLQNKLSKIATELPAEFQRMIAGVSDFNVLQQRINQGLEKAQKENQGLQGAADLAKLTNLSFRGELEGEDRGKLFTGSVQADVRKEQEADNILKNVDTQKLFQDINNGTLDLSMGGVKLVETLRDQYGLSEQYAEVLKDLNNRSANGAKQFNALTDTLKENANEAAKNSREIERVTRVRQAQLAVERQLERAQKQAKTFANIALNAINMVTKATARYADTVRKTSRDVGKARVETAIEGASPFITERAKAGLQFTQATQNANIDALTQREDLGKEVGSNFATAVGDIIGKDNKDFAGALSRITALGEAGQVSSAIGITNQLLAQQNSLTQDQKNELAAAIYQSQFENRAGNANISRELQAQKQIAGLQYRLQQKQIDLQKNLSIGGGLDTFKDADKQNKVVEDLNQSIQQFIGGSRQNNTVQRGRGLLGITDFFQQMGGMEAGTDEQISLIADAQATNIRQVFGGIEAQLRDAFSQTGDTSLLPLIKLAQENQANARKIAEDQARERLKQQKIPAQTLAEIQALNGLVAAQNQSNQQAVQATNAQLAQLNQQFPQIAQTFQVASANFAQAVGGINVSLGTQTNQIINGLPTGIASALAPYFQALIDQQTVDDAKEEKADVQSQIDTIIESQEEELKRIRERARRGIEEGGLTASNRFFSADALRDIRATERRGFATDVTQGGSLDASASMDDLLNNVKPEFAAAANVLRDFGIDTSQAFRRAEFTSIGADGTTRRTSRLLLDSKGLESGLDQVFARVAGDVRNIRSLSDEQLTSVGLTRGFKAEDLLGANVDLNALSTLTGVDTTRLSGFLQNMQAGGFGGSQRDRDSFFRTLNESQLPLNNLAQYSGQASAQLQALTDRLNQLNGTIDSLNQLNAARGQAAQLQDMGARGVNLDQTNNSVQFRDVAGGNYSVSQGQRVEQTGSYRDANGAKRPIIRIVDLDGNEVAANIKLQQGAIVNKRGIYTLGENGPEVVMPKASYDRLVKPDGSGRSSATRQPLSVSQGSRQGSPANPTSQYSDTDFYALDTQRNTLLTQLIEQVTSARLENNQGVGLLVRELQASNQLNVTLNSLVSAQNDLTISGSNSINQVLGSLANQQTTTMRTVNNLVSRLSPTERTNIQSQ